MRSPPSASPSATTAAGIGGRSREGIGRPAGIVPDRADERPRQLQPLPSRGVTAARQREPRLIDRRAPRMDPVAMGRRQFGDGADVAVARRVEQLLGLALELRQVGTYGEMTD